MHMSARNTSKKPKEGDVKMGTEVETKPITAGEAPEDTTKKNAPEETLTEEIRKVGKAKNTFFLRSEPNTLNSSLTSRLVFIDNNVLVLSEIGDFYKIRVHSLVNGYVRKNLIEVM